MMKYFYSKIGKGNSLVQDYIIDGNTPIKTPAVPIFFNSEPSNRKEFLEKGDAKEQGINFFWCSDNLDKTTIIVIYEGELFLLKPTREIVFYEDGENGFIKLLPVEIIVRERLSNVPVILSSMTANAYYYTGTFREIKDIGNIRAIQSVRKYNLTPFNVDSPEDLLYCLGSIELETLIAKIFEDAGCFVPAYRGGAIKGIDIFVKNITKSDISIGDIKDKYKLNYINSSKEKNKYEKTSLWMWLFNIGK